MRHCIEGYVGRALPDHPYYEALALYGTKLVGRSLQTAYKTGKDQAARADLCTAAMYGGLAFTKGLGIGHAIGHVLGGKYHIAHGRAVAVSLLCFVRANSKACSKQFSELAWAIDGSGDLESALMSLYRDIDISPRLRDLGVAQGDLEEIVFETFQDVPNLCGNPVPLKRSQVMNVLKETY